MCYSCNRDVNFLLYHSLISKTNKEVTQLKKIIITLSLISSLLVASTAFAANDNSSDRSNYVDMLNNCKAALKQSIGKDWKSNIEMMKAGN